MVEVEVKTNRGNIVRKFECKNVDDLYSLYRTYKYDCSITVNGEELKSPGWTSDTSYFAGYTKKSFNKFFK